MSKRILNSVNSLFLIIGFLVSPTLHGISHDLYMTASLSQDFTIGKRVESESGIYVSEDRKTARHLGFHHPRIDPGDYDPRDTDVLYFAALNGAIGTRDGGDSWQILTSWNMTEGKDLKVDPHNPDTLYLALPDGIAVSHDKGESWFYADSGIERKYTQSLAPDRERKGHILAGTEKGLYLSTDGSRTWERVLPTTKTVNHVTQSPHDADIFLAATQAEGVWISHDAGRTWIQLHTGEDGKAFHHAHFHPHNPEILTAGGWGFGLRLSMDGGLTWNMVDGLANDNVWNHAMDPDYPNRIYASLYRDTVYVSDDLGKSWERFLFPGATIWSFLFVPQK